MLLQPDFETFAETGLSAEETYFKLQLIEFEVMMECSTTISINNVKKYIYMFSAFKKSYMLIDFINKKRYIDVIWSLDEES